MSPGAQQPAGERATPGVLAGVAHTGVGLLLFQVLVLVSTAVVARELGPAGQARLQLLLSLSLAIAALARLGLDESAAFLLPRLQLTSPGQVRGVVLYVLLVPMGVALLLAWAMQASGALWIRHVFRMEQLGEELALLIPLTVATTLLLSGLGALRSLGRPDLRAWLYYYAIAPVLTLALIGISLQGWAQVGSVTLARSAVFLAGGLIAFAMAVAWTPRAAGGLQPGALRSLHGLGLFFVLGGFLQVVVEQPLVDLALVAALAGETEAGIYAVASRAAALLALVPASFVLVAGPSFARDVARGDRERIQRLYGASSRWMSRGALFLGGAMVVYRAEVLSLFGPEYVTGGDALALLVAGYALAGACGPNAPIIVALGRARLELLLLATFAAVMVLLGLLFGAWWGPLGVAGASALATAGLGLCRRAVVRRLGFSSESLLAPALAGLSASLLVLLLGEAVPAGGGALGASLLLYAGCFGAVLWAAERLLARR